MSVSGRIICRLATVLICFLALTGCATIPSNFQSVLQNMSQSYPGLWRLGTASAYVMGFFFALKSVYQLRVYGESSVMKSSHSSLKGPITSMIVSAALIALPTTFHDINMTLFATPNVLAYTAGPQAGFSAASTAAVIGAVQIMGLFAFIRGWVQIARTGEQSSQPGTMGKGLTHIIGGLLAINIVQTKDILWNTFGFS